MRVVAFQPAYFPDVHYLHRMMTADVVVVMDTVQFARRATPQQQMHHRANLPMGTLTVSIPHLGQRQTFDDLRTTGDWVVDHLSKLRKWYPSTDGTNAVAEAMFTAAGHTRYCTMIRYLYDNIIGDILPNVPEFHWLSTMDLHSKGKTLVRDICLELGADEYIVGSYALQEYLNGGEELLRYGISLKVQDIVFPMYGKKVRDHYNWSAIDLICSLGIDGARKYLGTLENQGWNEIRA